MTGRPPHLSPLRLLASLVVPLVVYVIIRRLTGSSVGALVITDVVPSAWLLAVGVVRRRVDPIAVLSALTVTVALGRPLLLLVAENVARLNPDPEVTARLAQPDRRRAVTILTAIIATTFAIDGAGQIVLALTVPTANFVADSTAVRIAVMGTGAVVAIRYFRNQKKRRDSALAPARKAKPR